MDSLQKNNMVKSLDAAGLAVSDVNAVFSQKLSEIWREKGANASKASAPCAECRII